MTDKKPNLILDELIFVAKKHLSLIILVLICSGLFYFLIPYVAQELGYADITETPYTGFMTLSTGVKMETADYNAMALETRTVFNALPALEQQRVLTELFEIRKRIAETGNTWTAGITEVSLLNEEQRKNLFFSQEQTLAQEQINQINPVQESLLAKYKNMGSIPSSFDWRNKDGKNYVSGEVGDQEDCGSCWAFAATGAIESAFKIYYNQPNKIYNLSEQDLISCYKITTGCSKGENAYTAAFYLFGGYLQTTGITSENNFKYFAEEVSCDKYKSSNFIYNIYKTKNYIWISYDNDTIRNLLYSVGPGSLSIYRVSSSILYYKGGIYKDVISSQQDPQLYQYTSHSVLLIGYGTGSFGDKYWTIKNSWGDDWGEQDEGGGGYGRVYEFNYRFNYIVPIEPVSEVKGDVWPVGSKYCGDGVVTLEDLYAMAKGIVTAGDSFNDCQKKKADLPTGSPCRPPDGEIDLFDMSTLEDKYLGRPNCIDGW